MYTEREAAERMLSQLQRIQRALSPSIGAASQLRRASGACCDLPDVGGHSHRTHTAVVLTSPWARFCRGERVSLPATLADGLIAQNFARRDV